MLTFKNPHSVLEALKRRPNSVLSLDLPSGTKEKELHSGWAEVLELARKQRIPIGAAPRSTKDSHKNMISGRQPGLSAQVREKEPVAVEELFEDAKTRAGGKGLWLALDCLQDPHNVGAIFRTAAFFGVQGILLTEERSAGLTDTVYDVASGGVEVIPYATEVNLARAMKVAKDAGLWILGSTEHAKDDFNQITPDRPWLLVLGNEEKGLRRLTLENCDLTCAIQPRGDGVKSLNVSVAGGIMIGRLCDPG